MRKVVITGMGMITALGSNVESTWENMMQGKSGVKKITSFDPSLLETQFAAAANDDFEEKAAKIIPKRQRKQMTRATRMLVVAADEAIQQSEINFDEFDRTKIGTLLGVISAGYDEFEKEQSGSHMIVRSMVNAPSAWVSMKYGLEGAAFSLSTACASSAYAISLGKSLIQAGVLDVAIVGGIDSHINPEYISGFNQILAMSTRNDSPETASRPFSKTRDGFVMGEGAGVMVLESEESAMRRSATIFAEVAGSALTSEASDITAPKKDGEGMAKTMKLALNNAKVEIDEVEYINAHGTSTNLNDLCETLAIKECFGNKAKEIAITSSKSMIGHTLGAAGVIEGISTVLTIYHGIIPPTINYFEADEMLDLDYVPNVSRKQNVTVALSNSFGFGGHNATVVYRKAVK
ncbi:beta-ketoacyl-[acyl-carrier-protein] synthase family protein [Alkaliphilus transvaalensis]|uniref:beta-ketoacyl-[acyl-carrier-protein] synthase family protein n=1 Tax=Alkaliphilus transvaalensis TaxID=114628 RepID=UPI00047DAE5D|nr:beta-ketoacyl-[acyl-carrier-protein] synthase family protein [Alkaliphilus transvaalensis]